jgi:hypothetical protein
MRKGEMGRDGESERERANDESVSKQGNVMTD